MTDKEFNNIKHLILSDNEEDNTLGVNILRTIKLNSNVEEFIYYILREDGVQNHRGVVSFNHYHKYFRRLELTQNLKLKDKYNE